jgi:hypothetical protein
MMASRVMATAVATPKALGAVSASVAFVANEA